MSYDLYYKGKTEDRLSEGKEIIEYFRGRTHYKIDENGQNASYNNEDTGVYFNFEIIEEKSGDLGDIASLGLVAFNINYARPDIFGEEAVIELTAFQEKFGLDIEDPQTDGMGQGPFSADGFLRGWRAGNRLGLSVMSAQHGLSDRYFLPAAKLHALWFWNYNRNKLGEKNPAIFYPKYFLSAENKVIHPYVLWPDELPIAIPENADLVVGIRKIYAEKGKENEMVIFTREEVENAFSDCPKEEFEYGKCLVIDVDKSDELKNKVEQFFRGTVNLLDRKKFVGVPFDSVFPAKSEDISLRK